MPKAPVGWGAVAHRELMPLFSSDGVMERPGLLQLPLGVCQHRAWRLGLTSASGGRTEPRSQETQSASVATAPMLLKSMVQLTPAEWKEGRDEGGARLFSLSPRPPVWSLLPHPCTLAAAF